MLTNATGLSQIGWQEAELRAFLFVGTETTKPCTSSTQANTRKSTLPGIKLSWGWVLYTRGARITDTDANTEASLQPGGQSQPCRNICFASSSSRFCSWLRGGRTSFQICQIQKRVSENLPAPRDRREHTGRHTGTQPGEPPPQVRWIQEFGPGGVQPCRNRIAPQNKSFLIAAKLSSDFSLALAPHLSSFSCSQAG
jgi:hypothetical protein